MVYGDGGAGKTTLGIDLACHLAAGDDWLGIRVARPRARAARRERGPRPLFRAKLRRKLEGWAGSPLDDRLHVLEQPWATLTFADRRLARGARRRRSATHEIDVVIVGPVTRLGMNEAGTLQEVRDFMAPRRATCARSAGRPRHVRARPPREQGRQGVGRLGGRRRHAAPRPGARATAGPACTSRRPAGRARTTPRRCSSRWTDGEGFARRGQPRARRRRLAEDPRRRDRRSPRHRLDEDRERDARARGTSASETSATRCSPTAGSSTSAPRRRGASRCSTTAPSGVPRGFTSPTIPPSSVCAPPRAQTGRRLRPSGWRPSISVCALRPAL